MLKKRIIITLTFYEGVLFRTKNFKPDYRYTKNFIDLWSADEIILIDVSKKKNSYLFLDIVQFFSRNCFVPISVGGGIKTKDQADLFFKKGADKVLLGSASIDNPEIIREISEQYGNQSIIQSLDLKKNYNNIYKVTKDSGQNFCDHDPEELCNSYLRYGAGEILINNVDNDGSLLGFDVELIKNFSNLLNCPVLVLGGAGKWEHIFEIFKKTSASAVCTQNIYHFTEESIKSAKQYLAKKKINIRV
jgi:cyclase